MKTRKYLNIKNMWLGMALFADHEVAICPGRKEAVTRGLGRLFRSRTARIRKDIRGHRRRLADEMPEARRLAAQYLEAAGIEPTAVRVQREAPGWAASMVERLVPSERHGPGRGGRRRRAKAIARSEAHAATLPQDAARLSRRQLKRARVAARQRAIVAELLEGLTTAGRKAADDLLKAAEGVA